VSLTCEQVQRVRARVSSSHIADGVDLCVCMSVYGVVLCCVWFIYLNIIIITVRYYCYKYNILVVSGVCIGILCDLCVIFAWRAASPSATSAWEHRRYSASSRDSPRPWWLCDGFLVARTTTW